MKKYFKLAVLLFATVSLASCGNEKQTSQEGQTATEPTEQVAEGTTEEVTSEANTCVEQKDCTEHRACGSGDCTGDCDNCPNN